MADRYSLEAKSFLAHRAFSIPFGAEVEIKNVTGEDLAPVAAKLLHSAGDGAVLLTQNGAQKEVALSRLAEERLSGAAEILLPARDFLTQTRFSFSDLIYIIHRLRDEDGCEWDKAQTHESIRSNAVEEAMELIEAINNKDVDNMREETGDVLLQGAFHAVIAEGNGEYDVSDVMSELCAKLIFRHPHVFGTVKASNQEEALAAWEQAKMKEKKQQTAADRMEHVAKTLSAAMRAQKVQKYARKVGFDFPTAEEASEKVTEELNEFLAASPEEAELEGGDLLFAAVNVLRMKGVDPEMALTRSVDKFVARFTKVENAVLSSGRKMQDLSIEELDAIYEEVKKEERSALSARKDG